MFDAFQGMEWVLIFLIILLIFGPSKLPQLAKGLGQAIYEFRKASQGLVEEPPPKPAVESGSESSQEELLRLLAEKLIAKDKGEGKAGDSGKSVKIIDSSEKRASSHEASAPLVEIKDSGVKAG